MNVGGYAVTQDLELECAWTANSKSEAKGLATMNCRKWLASMFFLVVMQPGVLIAQEPNVSASTPQDPDTKPPDHPVTEEQLRTYFAVCHVSAVSRQLTHEKLEAQRQQLPPWYPQPVWDEIEEAVDKIDMPKLALPIYQKYISETDAKLMIQLFASPQGQELVRKFLEATVQAQHAGLTPMQARDRAAAIVSGQENDRVLKLYNNMTPEQRRGAELFSQSSDYRRIQVLLKRIAVEFEEATILKQTDLAKAIALKHQAEMTEAKRLYDASHN